jgi:gamma-glutamylcyclotransferase (GGCT)/AIG2-like uncharacterized protein YtfP
VTVVTQVFSIVRMSFCDQSVFVYGTLKPGGHYWKQFCAGKVAAALPARICGQLYDLQVGYPGVLLRGDSWVQGYVLRFPNRSDFEQLDVLEGFVPGRPAEQNEYQRVRVNCYSLQDELLGEVWAYEMTQSTFRRYVATLIDDGNWPIE